MTKTDCPLVSVVITTYYRNTTLGRAIKSVQNQKYSPIEILVVDGSGTENARSVVEEFTDENLRYIPQAKDEGAQAARSLGAEEATGEYVNFLDDDDWFCEDKIRRQVTFLESAEQIGVVYCGKQVENGPEMRPDPKIRGDVLEYALKFQMTPSSPSTMLIDADVLEQILPLKHRHGADDLGMKIELAQFTEFDFIDDILVVIGESENSLGGSMENVEGRKRILQDCKELYNQFPQEVYNTALSYTYMLEGELILDEKYWSLEALLKILLGCYYIPGIRIPFFGYLFAAMFGRPGRDLGRRFYMEFIVGDQNRGKIA